MTLKQTNDELNEEVAELKRQLTDMQTKVITFQCMACSLSLCLLTLILCMLSTMILCMLSLFPSNSIRCLI